MAGLNMKWVISAVLFVLPAAITLGVLFSWDKSHEKSGGIPKAELGPSTPNNNKIEWQQQCNVFTGIDSGLPESNKVQLYSLTANPWGGTDLQDGSICVFAEIHNNGTYTTDYTAPQWYATWNYKPLNSASGNNVHAYPNMKVQQVFPKQIQNVKTVNMKTTWAYTVGSENSTTSSPGLTLQKENSYGLNANVAVDLFLDSDPSRAQQPDNTQAGKFARTEVMVWLTGYGAQTQTVGQDLGVVTTHAASGTTFSLYAGSNGKQSVYSWVPAAPIENFDGDLYPFISNLANLGSDSTVTAATQQRLKTLIVPVTSDYIGYMAFGTEAYFSTGNVTFTVSDMEVTVS